MPEGLEESRDELLERTVRELEELAKKGVKLYVDTIEGELPPEEIEKMKKMLEEA